MREDFGIRGHSPGETPEGGRSGGGYVVGNAWTGLVRDERGQSFYQTVSNRLDADGVSLHQIFCVKMRGLAATTGLLTWLRTTYTRERRTGSHNGAGYVTSQFRSSTESRLRVFNAVSRMD